MKQSLAFLVVSAAGVLHAADTNRPRGVGPEFAKFYSFENEFSCISNPSLQISLSKVNDDYCDCPDGSDEPGTSACSYLSPLSPHTPSDGAAPDLNTSLALPGFYCKNKGHNPAYIPFTYVNDGICDYDLCCDGSDEWQGVGGLKCVDKCHEIGREWKTQNEQRQKSFTAAMRRRKELVTDAAKRRLEIQDKIKVLATQIEAGEVKVVQLEQEKDEVTRREKSRVVKGGRTGGKASVLATLARGRLDQLRDGLADLRRQRDLYRDRVTELEEILSAFKEEYNPNFNDEGVKRAVRSWEEYAVRDKPEMDDGSADRDQDYEEMVQGAGEIDWAEFEHDGVQAESEVDILYQFEAYLPSTVRSWVDTKLRDFRDMLVKNGILAVPTDDTAVDNKATQEAESRLNGARTELDRQRKEKQDHEDDLTHDYGQDDVFRPLKDKCISLDSGEYTYELCWMQRVTQKSKKGHSSNGMGNFARMEKVQVDEGEPVNGKGLGTGERIAMKYENGAHCWNGPARSTTVVMACAESEEIWKVVEEEKCVYRMEVGTPAVCEPPASTAAEYVKDEL